MPHRTEDIVAYPMQQAIDVVTSLTKTVMPSSLPKTYKVAVFKEKGKPLEIEERELELPKDGQVSRRISYASHADHDCDRDS